MNKQTHYQGRVVISCSRCKEILGTIEYIAKKGELQSDHCQACMMLEKHINENPSCQTSEYLRNS